MKRAVVEFQPMGSTDTCQFILKEPPPNNEPPVPLGRNIAEYNPVAGDGVDQVVRAVGTALASVLVQNADVKLQLELTKNGDRKSYYFEIKADDADKRPWEALYYEDRFLALDPKSPIGRMCGSRDEQEAPGRYITLSPLRVLAILGVPATARAEFDGLREIFSARLKDPNMPVELKILTSDEDLRMQILMNPIDNVSVEEIDDKWSITSCVKRFRPKLIHISSDLTEGTSSCIRIVKPERDHVNEVLLEVPELRQFGDTLQLVWLITLSCAGETGAMKVSNNLARWLVRNGFPVAIGMQARVDWKIVYDFYSGFYEDALRRIEDIPVGGEGQDIDWADLLVEGRNRILHQGAESCSHWTAPVVYCRPSSVRLTRFEVPDTAFNLRIAAKIRVLARFCEQISASDMPDTDKGLLIQPALQQIEDLTRQFQPDSQAISVP